MSVENQMMYSGIAAVVFAFLAGVMVGWLM